MSQDKSEVCFQLSFVKFMIHPMKMSMVDAETARKTYIQVQLTPLIKQSAYIIYGDDRR